MIPRERSEVGLDRPGRGGDSRLFERRRYVEVVRVNYDLIKLLALIPARLTLKLTELDLEAHA
jgi:hypothetical protein